MRIFSSWSQLRDADYRVISEETAEEYRKLGVPIYQRGALPLQGTYGTYFAPGWSQELIEQWPFQWQDWCSAPNVDPREVDFDGMWLSSVVGYIHKAGKPQLVDTALSIARLGGLEAVKVWLASL